MRDFHLQFRLVDSINATVATCDAGPLKTSQWIRGQAYETVNPAMFKSVPAGHYGLWMQLIDPADGGAIALPLKGNDGKHSYPLGDLNVENH